MKKLRNIRIGSKIVLSFVTVIVLMAVMLAVTALAGGVIGRVAGAVGIVAATINVVSGFGVTDRMLKMFRGKGQDGEGQG